MSEKELLAKLWVVYPLAWIDFVHDPSPLIPLSDSIREDSCENNVFLQRRLEECCLLFLSKHEEYEGSSIEIEKFPYDDGFGYNAYVI